MIRTTFLTTLALLVAVAERAKADFVVATDSMTFVSNDSAPWIRNSSSSNSYPTTAGLGTFSFSFDTNSVPITNSLVGTVAGGLFVGVSSSGPGGGGVAAYTINAQWNFGTQSVLGFGFFVDRVSPETVLRAFNNAGGFQDFTLAPGFNLDNNGRGFVGIISDVPITGFRFSESVTDSTAVLGVSEVRINVAVPAPVGIVSALTGVIFLGGYLQRRRKQS